MRSSRAHTAAIAGHRIVTTLRVALLAAALIGPAALAAPSPLVTLTPAGRPGPTPTPLAALDGPPDARAVDRIPNLDVPEPSAGDVVSAGGIPISVRDLIVLFQPTTTVAEANALLRALPAEIVGGNPDAKALIIRLTGPSNLGRVLAAQATLLASPLVAAAAINSAAAPNTSGQTRGR